MEPLPPHPLLPPPTQLPQPLPSGAYCLQTSALRGYAQRGDIAHFHTLKIGDALTLCPEPANPYDEYAVRIHHRDRHIGYLPRESNHVVSRLLRQGAPLRAVIAWVDPTANLQLPLTLHVLWETAQPVAPVA